MLIRKAVNSDLEPLLALYTQLHHNDFPPLDESLEKLWQEILADKNHHILVGLVDNTLVTSCVVVVIPNLTCEQRPYALVENVITHRDYRNKGYGRALLAQAREIAKKENCYKIMLLTSSKEESTWHFYEQAGYNSLDKKAFIQWL